jgi:hypothetical protein
MMKPINTDYAVSTYGPRANAWPILGTVVVVFVAFVLGFLATILPDFLPFDSYDIHSYRPYKYLLIFVLVPIMLVLPWLYPWLGLIGVLTMLSGLLPISIHIGDVFFLYMLLILFFTHWRGEKFWWVSFRPYFFPLSLLFALAVVSTVYALFVLHTSPRHVLGELSHLLYWLLAPMVIVILDSDRKVHIFVRALLVLGVLLSLGLIVQSITGVNILSAGRLEQANLGAGSQDVYRSTTPGIFLVMFGMFLFTARYLWKVKETASELQWLLLSGAGIVFTYGRTLWLTSAIGMVYLVFLARGRRVLHMVLFAFAILPLGFGAIWVAKPHAIDAIIRRVESYGTEITSGQSLKWRFMENKYALHKIRSHPLMGVGLGGTYKPGFTVEIFEGEHRYIHNGYLYLVLKLGVLSMLPLVWLYRVIYLRGRQQMKDEMSISKRAIIASSLVVLCIPLITSLTRPEWMTSATVAILATLIGLMSAIDVLRRRAQESH